MPISLFRGGVPFINGKAHCTILVSNPDPSLSRSAGCIASPAALREREGSGYETSTVQPRLSEPLWPRGNLEPFG